MADPDDDWKCEAHGLNGKEHAEQGYSFPVLLNCLFHGEPLKDGGTFDIETGKDVMRSVFDRLTGRAPLEGEDKR